MSRVPSSAVTLGALLLLGACAAGTAENCDALNAGSVFQDFACKTGGGYDARYASIKVATHQRIDEASRLIADTQAQRQAISQLSRDRAALERQAQSLDDDLAMLQLQASAARARTATQEAQLAALREELAAAERELAALQGNDSATAEEIAKTQLRIEQKTNALQVILKEVLE